MISLNALTVMSLNALRITSESLNALRVMSLNALRVMSLNAVRVVSLRVGLPNALIMLKVLPEINTCVHLVLVTFCEKSNHLVSTTR